MATTNDKKVRNENRLLREIAKASRSQTPRAFDFLNQTGLPVNLADLKAASVLTTKGSPELFEKVLNRVFEAGLVRINEDERTDRETIELTRAGERRA